MQLNLPPQTIKQVRDPLLWLSSIFDGLPPTNAGSYTERRNTVLGTCAAGVYVGNTIAGVTVQDSIRLVRWEKD